MRSCSFVIALLAAGCVTSVEQLSPPLELGEAVQAECSSYCQDGEFYCPTNPLMECYWVCTVSCVVCDDVTTCGAAPSPSQSAGNPKTEVSSFCHKSFSCDGGASLYTNWLACSQAPECEGLTCEAVFVGCDPL